MTVPPIDEPSSRKPLRLWPGVAAVVLQWLLRFAGPLVSPEAVPIGIIGGMVCGLIVILWWLFFSRAAWPERLGAVVLMAAAMFATSRLVDESIAKGAMGMLLPILAIPVLSLTFVAAVLATRRRSNTVRRTAMVAGILAGCGVWTLARTNGFTGDFRNDLQWRWTPTPEERLLTQAAAALTGTPKPTTTPVPAAAPPTTEEPVVATAKISSEPALARPAPAAVEPPTNVPGEWPGFRGPHRDGVVPGARIATDWPSTPPVKLWQRPVGPGWSSFAVRGDLFYTQEQRGPEEVVACYRVSTGEPVWAHRDTARFWESNAGAGPRGTPTLGHDRVYTFGATGILNVLNARDGSVFWTRQATAEANRKIPEWGFASSPLLYGDLVIVAVSGQMMAYDRNTGEKRWSGPQHGTSYSSPQLLNERGVAQLVLLSANGVTGVAPADGKALWEHEWKGYPIGVAAVTPEGDLLVSVRDDSGIRRLALTQGPEGWHVEERWTSNGLKPYFNDFVIHKGSAFGFDGGILAAIDLKDGKRQWKGGRYGHGQLILLPDQDLLLVLSEEGELALVRAVPEGFTEVARVPAIEGKTWNHPVLAGDVLLTRNGEQMAAFRLTSAR